MLGLAALAVGCATRGPLTSLPSGQAKALVAGRVSVLYNQQVRTAQTELRFKQMERAEPNHAFFYGPGGEGPKIPATYRLDDSGLVVLELEPGQWILERIICQLGQEAGDMQYVFYQQDTSFELPQSGKLYYLGDLEVRWQGPAVKEWNLFRTLDPTSRPVNDGELTLTVKDDPEGMQAELARRYGQTPALERALLAAGQAVQPLAPPVTESGPDAPGQE